MLVYFYENGINTQKALRGVGLRVSCWRNGGSQISEVSGIELQRGIKGGSMKNTFRLFGIIALVTVIGFVITACPADSSGGTGNGGNDNGGNNNGGGSKTLVSIDITTQPAQKTYVIGDTIDLGGMVVTATYSDNTTQAVTGYTTSGFNSSTAGQKTVTVSYDGKTAAFTVTVANTPVASFTSIAELGTWLTAQPANTAISPYTVALNVSDLGGDYNTIGSLGNVLRSCPEITFTKHG
jgi:hypothetical protein